MIEFYLKINITWLLNDNEENLFLARSREQQNDCSKH